MYTRELFETALKRCGIGGRFSKFRVSSYNNWFMLDDFNKVQDTQFGFLIRDNVSTTYMEEISSTEATLYNKNHPEWLSYFRTAQKLMPVMVGDDHPVGDNRYYVDNAHNSLLIVNKNHTIEISPIERIVPEVSTASIYKALEELYQIDTCKEIKAFTRLDRVEIIHDGHKYCTPYNVEEFNNLFSEA